MPFQDIDEVSTAEYARPPGLVETWLRWIFIENWGLKLLALAITLALWLAVTGVNKPVPFRTGVQLNFVRPDNLEISNEPPRMVDVILSGRRSKLDNLGKLDLLATVDISDQREGERVVRLTPDRVRMDLPDGVKIESFQPGTISIHLEAIVERQLKVQVKLGGKPAEGFETYSVKATPDTIVVRGPAGHVNALREAPTETISIDGKRGSFTASHAAIDIPDPKVDLVESWVDVTVEIGERKTDKSAPRSAQVGPHLNIAARSHDQVALKLLKSPQTSVLR
jgi:YbbR domain-containing protein